MAKSGEFYSFDEVLRRLNIDENRLKRLVSEGEIRAFREGDQMKFKKGEIDGLAGKRGSSSETSLSEISMEDDVPKKGRKGGETLTDDLLEEPDLSKRAGMKTAEISSQDTFIDQGADVGMSTEPIDFTEEVAGEEPEQIGSEAAAKSRKAAAAAQAAVRRPTAAVVEAKSPLVTALLVLGTLVSIVAGMVVVSIAKKQPQESISQSVTKMFFTPPGGAK